MADQTLDASTVPVEGQERYVVHLPLFEGPLELLLHLIEKRQMEITMISLVTVTDQYLAYLQQWQAEQLPLANMAMFVQIAARLLFIKSQSLLPQVIREHADEGAESAVALAEELQHHLNEYRLAKQIAQVLKQRESEGLQTFARSGLLAGIEAQLAWTPPTLLSAEPQGLARALQRLLELQAQEVIQHGVEVVPTRRVRVSERVAEIRSFLSESPRVFLSAVLAHETSRFVIIVTFIAVLELWKWQRIEIVQEEAMGPIVLERGTRWTDEGEWDEIIED